MRWLPAVRAVLARPALWLTALRVWRLHLPDRWWSHRPFLPVPDRAWLRFRLQTQYGDPNARPDPADLVTWLEWSRGWRTLGR
ncbi:MAG TPA: hypothetical protein VEA78_09110 [Acidimicrobiales bacterium]|nr:hypothetical protein [Acidimicrobiales bacterium]